MEDSFAHLLLSPAHLASLRERLEKIQILKEDTQQTIRSFEAYATAGQHLCDSMAQMAECFSSYRAFQKDPTFAAVGQVISAFQSNLSVLFEQVREFVVEPLRTFLETDVAGAIDMSRIAAREFDAYMKAIDLYAAANKRKAAVDPTGSRLKAISEVHFAAAVSHLKFDQALLKVERKTLIEVSVNFLMFIRLSGVAYKQCVSDHESATEHFAEMTLALPASIANLADLSCNDRKQMMRLKACHEEMWRCRSNDFRGSTAMVHGGWLWKKGHGITHSWQRRFFEVRDSKLSYARDLNETESGRGELDLLTVSVKPLTDPDRRNCFSIISPFRKKNYVLQALTKYDVDEWQAVLQNNVQWLLDHTSDGAADLSGNGNGGVDPMELNTTCADCGASCPTWCCINWGTGICIKCAGVHRELSTAVSKVRSLTLDHLDAVLLSVLHRIGNEFANSVLAEHCTADLCIGPGADRLERMDFIRRKYEECEFVDDTEVVNVEEAIADRDVQGVFRAICQMKKRKETNDGILRLAAAHGDPVVCVLVGLNARSVDALDEQGWSPLSYAAYDGKIDAANALMLAGCDPNASQTAHPYCVAFSRGDSEVATFFLPYYNETERRECPRIGKPLLEVKKRKRLPSRHRVSLMLLPYLDLELPESPLSLVQSADVPDEPRAETPSSGKPKGLVRV
jgi:hypothetical protein